jgi:thiamine-phosphate pyrophosphorylase
VAPIPALHLITDRRLAADLPARALAALRGLRPRMAAVQLREKDLGGKALLGLAVALRRACHEEGQLLIVNDRIDVALAAGADGVHLPADGVPVEEARRLLGAGAIIGRSCHSLADVAAARAAGADYATFSPIHDTPSKRQYGAPLGLPALTEAAAAGLPLVALGGIDPQNAREAREAGAAGVAAIRAWLVGEDPAGAVRGLLKR